MSATMVHVARLPIKSAEDINMKDGESNQIRIVWSESVWLDVDKVTTAYLPSLTGHASFGVPFDRRIRMAMQLKNEDEEIFHPLLRSMNSTENELKE
ncbi:unnamed protein product [Sphenostylis stenocarpa]|uniref:Uncharacterized protein n=1 Tax=Sphenostylis stenocarpa TaxID=92480 RepID=A0AA86VGA5_9FABA|nr:unnamed protein product [Sphenostylis stenocarpa]